MTRSTSASIEVRCVTSTTVLPWANSVTLRVTCASVEKSIALVGSSSSSSGALCSTARASPTLCRWPPDSSSPRSPTGMSKPRGWRLTNSVMQAVSAAASTAVSSA